LRACETTDAGPIAAIYNHYVRDTVVTFEETPVSTEEMAARIAKLAPRCPWLVAEDGGVIVGYAYATPWKERSAYRFSVESTVYCAPGHLRRGTGTKLYRGLIAELKARNFHSAVGGIALPNPASIALHEKVGFRKVAHFAEVGFKLGRWVDVGYWQLTL
jgi:phosphinothricin acetyltransferase